MRKLTAALVALLLLAVPAAPKGGGDYTPERQSQYLEQHSETSNGETRSYSVDISTTSRSCATGDQNGSVSGDVMTRESFPPQHLVSFNGTVTTSYPCSILDYNVTSDDGTYTMNIFSRPAEQTCAACVGAVKYRANFEATGEDFERLEVQHNGETVETFSRSGAGVEDEENMTDNQAMNRSENFTGTSNSDNGSDRRAMNEAENVTNESDLMENITALLEGNDTDNETTNITNTTNRTNNTTPGMTLGEEELEETLNRSNDTRNRSNFTFNQSDNTTGFMAEEENFSPQNEAESLESNDSDFTGPEAQGNERAPYVEEEEPDGIFDWLIYNFIQLLEI